MYRSIRMAWYSDMTFKIQTHDFEINYTKDLTFGSMYNVNYNFDK
jgi:hypothetical protein